MALNVPSLIGLVGVLVVTACLSHPFLIVCFSLFVMVPGWLLSRLLRTIPFTIEERLILSVGLGIAWIPVASVLYKLLGIPLAPMTLVGLLAAMAVLAWRLRSSKALGFNPLTLSYQPNWFQLLMLALLFLSVVTRLAPFRHLEVPFFADPALQGMITRLILDHKRIPETWAPFVPLDFHYPPGFASIVAWVALLSHQPISSVIFFLTNFTHVLFPFSVYFLASAILPNRLQALMTALLAVLAAFPTATIIAGMNSTVVIYLLVPMAAGLAIRLVSGGPGQFHVARHGLLTYWPVLIGLTVLLTGAMLIHPVFPVFFLILVGPYVVLFTLSSKHLKSRRASLGILVVAFLCSLALTAPWFIHSATHQGLLGEQWKLQAHYVNPKQTLSPWFLVEPLFFLFNNPQGTWVVYLEDFTLGGLLTTQGVGLLMSGLFIYAIILILRDRSRLSLYLVSLYLIFLALSWLHSVDWLGFPGWRLIYPTRVKFLIVLPVVLLLARLFANVHLEDLRFPRLLLSLPTVLVILIVPYDLCAVTRYLHGLLPLSPVSTSDQEAIRWIERHAPNEAVILNTIKDVEAGVFIGGAGQWIPALTGRSIVFPALSLTEDVQNPTIADRLQIMQTLEAHQASSQAFLERLHAYGVQYIFLSPSFMHARRTLFPPIDPEQFLSSPYFRLEFHSGETYVFSILQGGIS